MRSKLGRIVTLSVAAAALVVASSASADAGTTTTTSASTTTSTSTTTTTTTTTTTSTTTTTTVPSTSTIAPPAPLVIELPAPPARVTPSRGTAAQVTDTLPPPPTTTTTTLPPSWALPAGSGTGRRIVYSKSSMRVWTVESDGTVSKTHLVSGRRTWNQPSPGTYSVFSRSSHTCNINNPHICWRYMVRFTKGPSGDNIGFHEIPTNTRTGYPLQGLGQLGQALSGGCVRQAPADALYIWNWAPIGTQVVVLG
jgi:lipoprotein-anchoring transpeptidase ErfK/SrfK